MILHRVFFLLVFGLLLITACGDKEEMPTIPSDPSNPSDPSEEPVVDPPNDLLDILHDPQPYNLVTPEWLGEMPIPADNPMTNEGVALGRALFYDPIISADSVMSCASCHFPSGSFTDNQAVSVGVDGIAGRRSSMSLLNVGYFQNGLFWDGGVQTLEEQALLPIEDPIELHTTWVEVIDKLRKHEIYPKMFRAAFDIADRDEMTKELAVKAIAQFERSLVSSGQSKYDQVLYGSGVFFTDDEFDGQELFFFESGVIDHPGCSHPACHSGPLFTSDEYVNNGLDAANDINDFEDLGRGAVTGNAFNNGQFRVPTLLNVALTPPYMHDGRFQTLEEVLDHYSSGGHPSPTTDSNILPFTLSEEDKRKLIAFLHTLTDTTFTNNPAHQNPFE
ncbi:MAG: cytochrome c peroxidase [Bacteroidota bacterium]